MRQKWRSAWALSALLCTPISMEMAPPKRWAKHFSVGALVPSPEHGTDSLLVSREADTVWRPLAPGCWALRCGSSGFIKL